MTDSTSSSSVNPVTPAHEADLPLLRADSSLGVAVTQFEQHMSSKGFSDNTIKAFRNDLKILRAFLDDGRLLRAIGTSDLEEFLEWMQNGRGKPCSAKTLARRITTLKVFFSWLHETGVLGTNPAEPVVQMPVRTPLPSILYDDEINRLQRAAQDFLWDRDKPDARPFLLLSLLIQTGMKKAECANLLVTDLDISRPKTPTIAIRYADTRYAHKNRTLDLHPNIIAALNQYLTQYKPDPYLFDCTPRNLEYVLDEVGKRAKITRLQVGFELLRWTCAVRDFRMGMPEERLRLKMGLSKISWRDTREKIFRLSGR
ncbi:MAG: site-specific integrase [Caldilineaceae bacterium]|nr:site-specific integrase [Caldilineaceae bacterium]MBP8106654.1 site-specific integrase [Caldilineaceae bacterium]MBP8122206.1 site-specific integrase [Caldilineaceae bacterium]MBP9071705.1 site-specific integrase [Caldilineaceae bacterium]